jgi:hypothetical protein
MIFVSDAAQFERIAGHLRAKIATKYGTKRIKINIYYNFKTGSKCKAASTKGEVAFCFIPVGYCQTF